MISADERAKRMLKAVFNILANNTEAAKQLLKGLEDDPESWLPFSVLYLKEENFDLAEYYIQRAAEAGQTDTDRCLRRLQEIRQRKPKDRTAMKRAV